MDVPHTVDSHQGFQHLPEHKALAVISWMKGMGELDRLGQDDGQGLGMLSGVRRQATFVANLRCDWKRGAGSWATADQDEQEHAAGCGGAYNSVTTNGLPPTLALISGTAATASALLAYSPTRTLYSPFSSTVIARRPRALSLAAMDSAAAAVRTAVI